MPNTYNYIVIIKLPKHFLANFVPKAILRYQHSKCIFVPILYPANAIFVVKVSQDLGYYRGMYVPIPVKNLSLVLIAPEVLPINLI